MLGVNIFNMNMVGLPGHDYSSHDVKIGDVWGYKNVANLLLKA
jgi:hypothetical protein